MENMGGEHVVGDTNDRGTRKQKRNLTSRERKKQVGYSNLDANLDSLELSGENWYDDADLKWLIPVLNQEVDPQDDSDEDEMKTKLFGIDIADLRKISYDFAERNGARHNFSKDLQQAGTDWMREFLKKHSHKIIAKRGRKQVSALSSAERGQLVTPEMYFSAAGQYIPPMLIFPRQRMKQELMDGAPPGAVSACHESGWMKDRQIPPPNSSVGHETVNYEEAVNHDSLPESSNSSFTLTTKDICSVPKRQRKETKRKRGTSAVLTSTPYKTELEENQNSSVKPVKRKVKIGKDRPKKKRAKKEFSINKASDSEKDDKEDNPLCEVSAKTIQDGFVSRNYCTIDSRKNAEKTKKGSIGGFYCDNINPKQRCVVENVLRIVSGVT
ncbi:hypothetical protein ILUMI_26426 [Ignelater luminosus]|uniref:Uncharacterized protein n=1 Tax=Ignelater luminosus TaxID=2038154 RepID=A0A8K0C9T6_IGNLU|nr:hypothetical protein ILUMI_26426 [Ignelater luminosus]